jgi:hypothetical protein
MMYICLGKNENINDLKKNKKEETLINNFRLISK